ncbi:hypothetical protein IMG5_149270 [Ichthyophthirius multifiliis]|uniref:Uncharacterized protein n=1 Tax=Ichthyophthirius multifiliis TaxID=5932 RepID=G0QYF8_ICHMU|nr:hypothetical protein IMG5_149270 [Ichthyophthirius multifiliis]EGR29744.1 hypothetical protein IMG5_149270 [Ichthyophthirius multifiliis]|eukprot:XP_004030980.1 hypothetical protein IMG5_149270 [Ichthyophthirius multifiliis]
MNLQKAPALQQFSFLDIPKLPFTQKSIANSFRKKTRKYSPAVVGLHVINGTSYKKGLPKNINYGQEDFSIPQCLQQANLTIALEIQYPQNITKKLKLLNHQKVFEQAGKGILKKLKKTVNAAQMEYKTFHKILPNLSLVHFSVIKTYSKFQTLWDTKTDSHNKLFLMIFDIMHKIVVQQKKHQKKLQNIYMNQVEKNPQQQVFHMVLY